MIGYFYRVCVVLKMKWMGSSILLGNISFRSSMIVVPIQLAKHIEIQFQCLAEVKQKKVNTNPLLMQTPMNEPLHLLYKFIFLG